ncbi:short chain dehydrogenase [Setomelanomma holmii]|uniref:Short chain dehydrogenase n=1 Tax=Setomelanomma holmii TaxID=210430 RepID=A0A9P4HCH0_9PLEO|nr:short chain dehydrogenase [Setomelanomma holmii]
MSDLTKYTSKLASSRILIIGGSSGIGFAVAAACLEHDALVAISSSNASRVDAAVKKLQSSYPSKSSNIVGLTVDLSKSSTLESELKTLLDGTVSKIGGQSKKLDHVVFTAGDALATIPLAEMSMEKVLQAGQIRFFAPLMLAKYLPSYLEPSYKSSYTVTTGAVSEKPIPNWSVIGSYAGGHHSMVRNLALDLKPLRVNGISPGVVNTELWRMSDEQKEKVMKFHGEHLATGRAGQPEDVAESYLALLKDWNMTGSMVRTDGGGLLGI